MQRFLVKSCTKINHELKLSHAISRLLWTAQQYDILSFCIVCIIMEWITITIVSTALNIKSRNEKKIN